MMDRRKEAAKLRAEIVEAKAKVKTRTGQIRHREGRLLRIAVDAFNKKDMRRVYMLTWVTSYPCLERHALSESRQAKPFSGDGCLIYPAWRVAMLRKWTAGTQAASVHTHAHLQALP